MKLMVIFAQYAAGDLELRHGPVLAAASPGTEIELVEIKVEAFKHMCDADSQVFSMMAGPLMVEKAVEARRRGFDAVLPWGTLDLGVDACRRAVDIPVVAMGRNAFCVAAHLVRRIGVIVYEANGVPRAWQAIWEIGLKDFVTSVRAVGIPTRDMREKRDLMRQRFIELGRRAVQEEDAELILPRGVGMVPTHFSAEEMTREIGVPVLDPVAAAVKTAEMLASMGMRNSRKAYVAIKPSAGSAT